MSKRKTNKSFGQTLREKRIAKGFSLRKFAELVDVSPTYLSQVEQDKIAAPTADRVRTMAEELGENVDEWTALAGRLTEDLPDIIHEAPSAVPDLLRAIRGLSPEQLRELRKRAERMKREDD
jgi:transcriptional regulator with XRE-family HTH domain